MQIRMHGLAEVCTLSSALLVSKWSFFPCITRALSSGFDTCLVVHNTHKSHIWIQGNPVPRRIHNPVQSRRLLALTHLRIELTCFLLCVYTTSPIFVKFCHFSLHFWTVLSLSAIPKFWISLFFASAVHFDFQFLHHSLCLTFCMFWIMSVFDNLDSSKITCNHDCT